MRTEKEIREYLEKIEADERLSYPQATVFTNAPLALIQVSLEAEVSVLRWILSDKKEEGQ